jgi:anti-anti-sigma factor
MNSQPENTVFTYRFGERITIENADRLVSEISLRFDSPSISKVIFDMENLRECSSYGLRMFLIFQRRAEQTGKSLLLYRPTPAIMELLSITRLDHVFSISETTSDS